MKNACRSGAYCRTAVRPVRYLVDAASVFRKFCVFLWLAPTDMMHALSYIPSLFMPQMRGGWVGGGLPNASCKVDIIRLPSDEGDV